MGERRAGDFARKKNTILFYFWLVGAGRDAAANDDSEMISGLFHFGAIFFLFSLPRMANKKYTTTSTDEQKNVFIARTMVLLFFVATPARRLSD